MCGRYALNSTPQELMSAFRLAECADFRPRFNIAPLQVVPVVRERPNGERVAHLLRWGLLPAWAKDESLAGKMINARAETLAEKPAFRAAFRARRCLIPASGFYEWQALTGGKQPWFIHGADSELLAFAGLWERWQPEGRPPLDTFTIVTTSANDMMTPLHERMPVILKPADQGPWLARGTAPEMLAPLLAPAAEAALTRYRVSPRVGKVGNDDRDCLAPVSVPDEQTT